MGPGREAMFSFGRPRPTRRSLGPSPYLAQVGHFHLSVCQRGSLPGRGSVGVDKLGTSTEVGDISLT